MGILRNFWKRKKEPPVILEPLRARPPLFCTAPFALCLHVARLHHGEDNIHDTQSCAFVTVSQPVHPKGDQSWVFIGRTDAEAETPILGPPHVKSWLIGKDPDAGRDWGQEEKGTTEDEMAGWHHRLDGHEFEWTPGVGDGQGGLACCDSWGRKESDMTERLNWTELVSGKTLVFPFAHGSFYCKGIHLPPSVEHPRAYHGDYGVGGFPSFWRETGLGAPLPAHQDEGCSCHVCYYYAL